MPKYELIKLIEAQRLNPRTGIPTADPPVTIPFGAIIENITPDRDMDKFVYLGQNYQCAHDILESAICPVAAPAPAAPAKAAAPAAQAAPAAAVAYARAAAPATVAPEAPAPTAKLVWERLDSTIPCQRAKVPGGWLVAADGGLAFYPDAGHSWDGTSLP
ncbi:MAG: hypothetical protein ACM3ZB_08665 [bacterium]|jgi:hypothetical protein